MIKKHGVYFEDQLEGLQRLYTNPREIITAYTQDEVGPALTRMRKCQKDGLYLAGYFAYELGYALEPVLGKLMPTDTSKPLLQFGVFDGFERVDLPFVGTAHIDDVNVGLSETQYQKSFTKIMDYIRAGDVYQINLSFPVAGKYYGGIGALYHKLKSRQPVRYGGVIDLGGEAHITLSPELFFETKGSKIHMRPMKGTIKRGATQGEDKALADSLQQDEKNRAENLMIVDLLRNDLSRLSVAGSVKVTDLFSVETFPTLHTLTSGIEAKLKPDTDLRSVLRALFPCGSITGAPKIRAQEIIAELENRRRGAYCGALGLIDPDGNMRFNVGIRTLTLKDDGSFTYPVGSGVVADSIGADEYAECLLKAKFLQGDFGLIETIGYEHVVGFMHFDLHMERLENSAQILGFVFDREAIHRALIGYCERLKGAHKMRLELARNGHAEITSQALKLKLHSKTWRVAISKNPIDSQNPLLVHKTTERSFIEAELARLKQSTGCDEVLFFNENGELCEGSFTNVFIVKERQMTTPPITCGLLPGTLRRVLIANGDVSEQIITHKDLIEADEVYIGNSVRGLMRVELIANEKL